MHDALTDLAYDDARSSFEGYREDIINRALDEHDKAMTADYEGRIFDGERHEAEAQRLLREANSLVYTGLMWQADNGLMDD